MFGSSMLGGLSGFEEGTPWDAGVPIPGGDSDLLGDEYWPNTVLLTSLDLGTPVDDSPSGHTLTVNSATQDSIVRKSGASSFDFGNGTENISAGDSADWDFADGEFTVEAWVYFDSAPSGTDDPIFIGQWDDGVDAAWMFGIVNGNLRFSYTTDGTTPVTAVESAWSPSSVTWYHVAASKVGSTIYISVDGTILNSAALSATFHSASVALQIGWPVGGSGTNFQRNIDEVRITKGVGRYSAAFTPLNSIFPRDIADRFFDKVSVLMDFNTTAVEKNLGQWVDQLFTVSAITRNTSGPIEGGGDGDIGTDGNIDLHIGENGFFDKSFDMGTREWTFECDLLFDSNPSTANAILGDIFSKWDVTGSGKCLLIMLVGSGSGTHEIRVEASSDGTTTDISSDVDLGEALTAAGGPYRFAFTREGDNVLVHMDGSYIGAVSLGASFDIFTDNTQQLRFGVRLDDPSSVGDIDAKVDLIRVTVDTARYTTSDYDWTLQRVGGVAYPQYPAPRYMPRLVQYLDSETDASSHVVDLPSNLTTGNKLVAFVAIDSIPTMDTLPSGWSETKRLEGSSSDCTLFVLERPIDGTEGATATFVSSTSEHAGWLMCEYADADSAAVEVSTGTTGATATPDPGSITFSHSEAPYLCVGFIATGNGSIQLSDTPTTPVEHHAALCRTVSGTNGASAVCTAHAPAYGVSGYDPGAFTLEASEQTAAVCCAIYGAAPAENPSFSPMNIPGLLVWFDASDLATITKDGSDRVSQWDDKSGNARHITQGTGADQPLWLEAEISGLDAIEFDSSNTEYMSRAAEDWMRPTNITLIVVMDSDSTGGTHFAAGVPYDGGTWGSPFVGWQIGAANSDTQESRYWVCITDVDQEWTVNNQFTAGTPVVTTLWYDGTRRKSYTDDTETFNNTDESGDITYGSPDPTFAIGTRSTGGLGEYFDGKICEVIAYDNGISDEDLANLHDYLMTKWGIT